MKIATFEKYGSPDVVHITEVEKPTPQADEVIVKIKAASVNATDFEIVRGMAIVRMGRGLRKPKSTRLGCDFAGIVDSIGKDVTTYHQGDEVYADLMYERYPYGAFAEYVCIPEQSLRAKPNGMTFEQAATIPQAGVLAMQGMTEKNPPYPGQQVLINGAGGGVGTFAIQIAKYYGAEVTAVDHRNKFEILQSLGADHLIDYTKQNFTKTGSQYDLILDVIARHSAFAYRRALKPGGVYRMVGGSTGKIFNVLLWGSLLSKFSTKKIGLLMGRPNDQDYMEQLTQLFDAGGVKPVIDKTYPLDSISDAIAYIDAGLALGKVIITMD